jgi:hypothetical protein
MRFEIVTLGGGFAFIALPSIAREIADPNGDFALEQVRLDVHGV